MPKRAKKITMTIDREMLKERLEQFVSETFPHGHSLDSFTVHRSGGVELVVKVEGVDEQPELPGVADAELPK